MPLATANTGGLRLRDAQPDDLVAIVAIYNSTIPGRMATAHDEPVSLDSRRLWFDEHSPDAYPLWVLESGGGPGESAGEVIAWLSFSPFHERPAYRGTAELSVYVAESARGRGSARTLLHDAIAAAPGLGFHHLVGLIFGHNAPSLSLFADFGFERWGVLPGVAVLDEIPRDVVVVGLALGE